ncbi:metallopeptidase family protein [Rhodobacteraceae bacterium]|nr:metallopeptidase family protein [Paracoccaceae bacterium]
MTEHSNQNCTTCTPPSLDDIAALAEAARADLPDVFAAPAASVVLRVEEFASQALLDALGIADPFILTGLYEGVPLPEKSVMDPGGPDIIWLFRRPIIEEWAERGDVPFNDLVTHVYIHELAHHFGWSDDDIARIDRWWE